MNRFLLVAAASAVGSFFFSNSVGAAAIAIDFGGTGQEIQSGYLGVSGSGSGFLGSPVFSVPASALPGGESMTITSSSSLSFRDRGNASAATYGAEADLLEDYIRAGTATAANGVYSTMTIDLGGLLSNTPYQITIRLYDGAISATTAGAYSFTITGTGDSNLANNNFDVPFHSGFPGLPPEQRAGYTETFVSNALGGIQVLITQTAGLESSIPMNSFDLVAVPEPGTGGAAAAGLLFGFVRRRPRSSAAR